MIRFNRLRSFAFVLIVLSLVLSACAVDPTQPVSTDILPPLATQPAASATAVQPAASDTAAPAPADTDAPPSATTAAPVATVPPAQPDATTLPDAKAYGWREVTSGLNQPVGAANAGDGSGRLFFIEKDGTIRILSGGQLSTQPFLDIRERVGSEGSEQGLLGLAFDPDYSANGFFYVYYTNGDGNTVVSRFSVTSDPNLADPSSEKVLLTQNQPYANHNGGGMEFGPDGFLYVSLGDGGSGGDPEGNGQDPSTFLGKLLRIDVHSGDPYAIPPGNAFMDGSGRPEIYAWGLRNAWRFAFDRVTGDMWIADVGQNQWEEVNFLPAGSLGGVNFGWDYREAGHAFEGSPPAGLTLTDPIFEYDHGQGCSITGGFVYRGAMPEWQGVYLFGDYCTGRIWGTLRQGDSFQSRDLFQLGGTAITAFGQDEGGEIYLVAMSGVVYRLERK